MKYLMHFILTSLFPNLKSKRSGLDSAGCLRERLCVSSELHHFIQSLIQGRIKTILRSTPQTVT